MRGFRLPILDVTKRRMNKCVFKQKVKRSHWFKFDSLDHNQLGTKTHSTSPAQDCTVMKNRRTYRYKPLDKVTSYKRSRNLDHPWSCKIKVEISWQVTRVKREAIKYSTGHQPAEGNRINILCSEGKKEYVLNIDFVFHLEMLDILKQRKDAETGYFGEGRRRGLRSCASCASMGSWRSILTMTIPQWQWSWSGTWYWTNATDGKFVFFSLLPTVLVSHPCTLVCWLKLFYVWWSQLLLYVPVLQAIEEIRVLTCDEKRKGKENWVYNERDGVGWDGFTKTPKRGEERRGEERRGDCNITTNQ